MKLKLTSLFFFFIIFLLNAKASINRYGQNSFFVITDQDIHLLGVQIRNCINEDYSLKDFFSSKVTTNELDQLIDKKVIKFKLDFNNLVRHKPIYTTKDLNSLFLPQLTSVDLKNAFDLINYDSIKAMKLLKLAINMNSSTTNDVADQVEGLVLEEDRIIKLKMISYFSKKFNVSPREMSKMMMHLSPMDFIEYERHINQQLLAFKEDDLGRIVLTNSFDESFNHSTRQLLDSMRFGLSPVIAAKKNGEHILNQENYLYYIYPHMNTINNNLFYDSDRAFVHLHLNTFLAIQNYDLYVEGVNINFHDYFYTSLTDQQKNSYRYYQFKMHERMYNEIANNHYHRFVDFFNAVINQKYSWLNETKLRMFLGANSQLPANNDAYSGIFINYQNIVSDIGKMLFYFIQNTNHAPRSFIDSETAYPLQKATDLTLSNNKKDFVKEYLESKNLYIHEKSRRINFLPIKNSVRPGLKTPLVCNSVNLFLEF